MELQISRKEMVVLLYYVLTKENQWSQPKEIIVCILLVFVLHSIIGNIIIMASTSIDIVIVVLFGIIIVTVEASFVRVVRYYKIQFPNYISKYVNNLQYNETAHTVWASLKKVT